MSIEKINSLIAKHSERSKYHKNMSNKYRKERDKTLNASIGKGIRQDHPIVKKHENGKQSKIHDYDYKSFQKYFNVIKKGTTSGATVDSLKSKASAYSSAFCRIMNLATNHNQQTMGIPKYMHVDGDMYQIPDFLRIYNSVKSPASNSSETKPDNTNNQNVSDNSNSKNTNFTMPNNDANK